MQNSFVSAFSAGHAGMKSLLGGKGANLAEMTSIGLPVPPGFTVTTDACREYFRRGMSLPDSLMEQVKTQLKEIEKMKNQTFGSAERPLLVSVRSGAVASMPGMMDTILNVGLNDETVEGLAKWTKNEQFAYDCYRRLIQMFGNVVMGIASYEFEDQLQQMKQRAGNLQDYELPVQSLKILIENYKRMIVSKTNQEFPQNVYVQLEWAIAAVFRSWQNERAKIYRQIYQISDEEGTAVNIQSMVFGNLGETSGTGVVFTRNPSTGDHTLYGEFLSNAQGEDVVAGIRTPLPISQLADEQPDVYHQLVQLAEQLERHYKDMQDIEFTIEEKQLYLLQTRNGKRTAQAAIKLAVEFVGEKIITKEEALMRIDPAHLDQLLHRAIDAEIEVDVIATGLPASPGAASGLAVFDADLADQWKREGKKVILVSGETTPEDIHGVIAAEGILTSRGGMTSHAAVVARGIGKPCICGCEQIEIDSETPQFIVGNNVVRQGDWITIDGSTGRVISGVVPLKEPEMTEDLSELLRWADETRTMQVFTNADHEVDASKAREFGAEGIGLCRTEHMFMAQDRLPIVRKMIMAENLEERNDALRQLLPIQREDFRKLFMAMEGLPVTIRLLDPPLHEFLPHLSDLLVEQERLKYETIPQDHFKTKRHELDSMIRRLRSLHEMNPMLGQRGCRVGIVFPEIYEMQIRAIFEAAMAAAEEGIAVQPDIMIPLVGHSEELARLRELVVHIADQMFSKYDKRLSYRVGTMIEVPRAALTAEQIAIEADFFSFGTNDLTQMTFGYSRDDAEGKFLTHYIETGILKDNPFQTLDIDGVGQLVKLAKEKGVEANPQLVTGVCGEHGGDPRSILFCHQLGLNYVSCSPYRVPLARIAAAQAKIQSDL